MDQTQQFGVPGQDPQRTQALNPDPNRTQAFGGDPNRTQAFQGDINRTQMAPEAGAALQLEVVAGNRYALSTRNSREHVLVRARAGQAATGQRMPLNVCLLLDRSGSMEGQPLEFAKQAMSYVVDLLQPNDVLSVVTFEDNVEVLMPARRVVNKDLIKQHIGRIQPGNTTNLYEGFVAACSQVASVPPGYVNRVILLTDGEPTAGLTDFQSIVGQVAEQKSRGITLTTLGFGQEYNEELLMGMARRAGGNYYYIQRPELLPEVFRKEMDSLLSVVARNLRLVFWLSRWTQVRQVYGKQPVWGDRRAEVTLADLERGETLSALAEMELGNRPGGTYRIARVELLYDDALTGRQERATGDAVFEFTADEALIAANRNPSVDQELQVALASRNIEKTVMGMRTQAISTQAAVAELEKTQALFQAQGRTQEAAQIQEALDAAKGGADLGKTLVGTVLTLDQGKSKQ
ncbi:MAG: VWA domain-containing protein [Armatimonadetes bacterium]|nr:VWA domain-containing protein [Armatimonadota bacterium]